MVNKADYSLYKCPYSHLKKDCGHKLHGPEGYPGTYGVWCQCGFRGPVFYLDPVELKLEKIESATETGSQNTTHNRPSTPLVDLSNEIELNDGLE
jgi:hypothetical protein